jgi:hypothetical protein
MQVLPRVPLHPSIQIDVSGDVRVAMPGRVALKLSRLRRPNPSQSREVLIRLRQQSSLPHAMEWQRCLVFRMSHSPSWNVVTGVEQRDGCSGSLANGQKLRKPGYENCG